MRLSDVDILLCLRILIFLFPSPCQLKLWFEQCNLRFVLVSWAVTELLYAKFKVLLIWFMRQRIETQMLYQTQSWSPFWSLKIPKRIYKMIYDIEFVFLKVWCFALVSWMSSLNLLSQKIFFKKINDRQLICWIQTEMRYFTDSMETV